jgi:hypothetical protein
MPKKDGSSSIKTIEQVREATQADVKRVKNTPPTAVSERKQRRIDESLVSTLFR